jgi:hypothetical protein
MSYHIGLFDDICLQRWVGFGHWDRGTSYCVVFTFHYKEFRQRHTKYWNGAPVYYLSVSGPGSLGDVNNL